VLSVRNRTEKANMGNVMSYFMGKPATSEPPSEKKESTFVGVEKKTEDISVADEQTNKAKELIIEDDVAGKQEEEVKKTVDTEITDDFEVVPSETNTVVSEDASNQEKVSLDFSNDKIVAIVEKVTETEANTEFECSFPISEECVEVECNLEQGKDTELDLDTDTIVPQNVTIEERKDNFKCTYPISDLTKEPAELPELSVPISDLTKETVELPETEHLIELETKESQAEAVPEASTLVDVSFKEPKQVEEGDLSTTEPEPKRETKEATPEVSNSEELIIGEEKCTSITSETVMETADLLTIEKEENDVKDQAPEESTLLVSDKIEHIEMPDDVTTKSGSGNNEEVEIIGSIQDNEIEAKDTLIETAEQSAHSENSVEADTSVEHIEADVEEKEKVDHKVIEEEDNSEATEEVKELHTFDKEENEKKGDELKSEAAIAAQDKQVAEDETVETTDAPALSETSSNEETEKADTKLTVECSKNIKDFENQEDAVVEVIGSIEDEIEKKMDDEENQTGILEQPIVPKTKEEDIQEKVIEGINRDERLGERKDNESKGDEPTVHETECSTTGTTGVSSDFEKSDEGKSDISEVDDTAVKAENNHVELTTDSEQKPEEQLADEQDPSVSDVEVIGSIQDDQVDSEKDMTEIKPDIKKSSEIKSESSATGTEDAFEVSNEDNDESVVVTRAQKGDECENKDMTDEEQAGITSNGLTNSEDVKGH